MPRTAGVYALPGARVVDGEVIFAAQVNDPLTDLAAEQNAARPVEVGGTGATTKAGARTALEAQKAAASLDTLAALDAAAAAKLGIVGGSDETAAKAALGLQGDFVIATDAVAEIDLPFVTGIMTLIRGPNAENGSLVHSDVLFVKAGTGSIICRSLTGGVAGGSLVLREDGVPLTGTTGAALTLTVSPLNGVLYVENRLGFSATMRTVFGG